MKRGTCYTLLQLGPLQRQVDFDDALSRRCDPPDLDDSEAGRSDQRLPLLLRTLLRRPKSHHPHVKAGGVRVDGSVVVHHMVVDQDPAVPGSHGRLLHLENLTGWPVGPVMEDLVHVVGAGIWVVVSLGVGTEKRGEWEATYA